MQELSLSENLWEVDGVHVGASAYKPQGCKLSLVMYSQCDLAVM